MSSLSRAALSAITICLGVAPIPLVSAARAEVVPEEPGDPAAAEPAGPPPPQVARWPIYLFAGLALGATAGAVLLRDEEDLFPAMVVGAAGFGVTAVGVTLDVRARSRRATLLLQPTPRGGVASLGWWY